MDAQLIQDCIEVIQFQLQSGNTVEDCIRILKITNGNDVLDYYPDEVEEAFDAVGYGPEYRSVRAKESQMEKEKIMESEMNEVDSSMVQESAIIKRWSKLAGLLKD